MLAGLKRHPNLEKMVIIEILFSPLSDDLNGLFVFPSGEKDKVWVASYFMETFS
jgi:hypothetical protein